MKSQKNWKSFAAGMLTMALILALGIPALAAGNIKTLQNVTVGGIHIVIDGKELHPTDVNGNPVDPFVYNGTTYLPIRAVANALGKAVSWDGPTYTVYLGNMDGQLEYPTVMLKDMTSIAEKPRAARELTDNYGNHYNSAIDNKDSLSFEYLLNMKYSRFKGTLYIPQGSTYDGSNYLTIEADGRVIYTSPEMWKTSAPVDIDLDVTGYNDIKISYRWWNGNILCLADAGFYQ